MPGRVLNTVLIVHTTGLLVDELVPARPEHMGFLFWMKINNKEPVWFLGRILEQRIELLQINIGTNFLVDFMYLVLIFALAKS